MNVFVFDVDDTIIIHTNEGNDYYGSNKNSVLKNLLSELKNSVFYFYTNGTFSHGKAVEYNLDLNIKRVFARDVIPQMKPERKSFHFVHNQIVEENEDIQKILFFDDLEDNLFTAKTMGWTTVWINPTLEEKEDFVDYSFSNIYEAIHYFKRNL